MRLASRDDTESRLRALVVVVVAVADVVHRPGEEEAASEAASTTRIWIPTGRANRVAVETAATARGAGARGEVPARTARGAGATRGAGHR